MCGIVGYTGKGNATDFLLAGLHRLEYRGYDSAGISIIDNSLQTIKAVGKVANLAAKTGTSNARIGIGHTRWATHGAPSERNAHPHLDRSGHISIVHNGIIENSQELRRRLEQKGVTFHSETDSEVIAHLIGEAYDGDLAQAVAATVKQLTGTYGLAVITDHQPDRIVCARNGSPIIIGVGEEANMVASDAAAFTCSSTSILYLEDGELAILTPQGVSLRTIDNVPVERELSKLPGNSTHADKGTYDHYMLKEIHEQPEAIANTIRGRLDAVNATAQLSGLNLSPRDLSQINRIVIAACGSSLHAGLIGGVFSGRFCRYSDGSGTSRRVPLPQSDSGAQHHGRRDQPIR